MSIQSTCEKVLENIERVILGKREEIRHVLVALLCEGHVLVEDVPGVGKTMLSRAVARSFGCSFARVQCTPDLLPTDLTGVNIYNQKTSEFEFRAGPLHNQIVLADEINRATPKTQSALLECMEEGQVTVDGTTYVLQKPFIVMATQNPIEYEGTFPLPEAQLDRFLLRIKLGYPDEQAESEMLLRQQTVHPIEALEQVVSAAELQAMQVEARKIHVDDSLRHYVVALVRKTRESEKVYLGASPRGSLALFRACQALAALHGRTFVTPDDIKQMAVPTLSHRLIGPAESASGAGDQVVLELLDHHPVPV